MLCYVFKRHVRFQLYQEKYVETKGAIRSHKSEAINRRRTDHKMVTRKSTNNDLQNTT